MGPEKKRIKVDSLSKVAWGFITLRGWKEETNEEVALITGKMLPDVTLDQGRQKERFAFFILLSSLSAFQMYFMLSLRSKFVARNVNALSV